VAQGNLAVPADLYMIELLDIDLDFVVRGTAGAIPRPPQSLSPEDQQFVDEVLRAHASNAWFMDEHAHALQVWVRHSIRAARCWHIDAHHDMYGSTDTSIWRRRATAGDAERSGDDGCWTSATYLLYAWRAGIVRDVVWVIPDWLSREDAEADLRREMGRNVHFIHVVRAADVAIPSPDVTTVAWSRRWIDRAYHEQVCRSLPSALRTTIEKGPQIIPFSPCMN